MKKNSSMEIRLWVFGKFWLLKVDSLRTLESTATGIPWISFLDTVIHSHQNSISKLICKQTHSTFYNKNKVFMYFPNSLFPLPSNKNIFLVTGRARIENI